MIKLLIFLATCEVLIHLKVHLRFSIKCPYTSNNLVFIDCISTEAVRLEDSTPGPSHRSESNNETNVQPEAQEDNIDIDENDLGIQNIFTVQNDLILN